MLASPSIETVCDERVRVKPFSAWRLHQRAIPGVDAVKDETSNETGLAWEKIVHVEAGSEERKTLRDALRAYCKQDMLAMVRLLEALSERTRDR